MSILELTEMHHLHCVIIVILPTNCTARVDIFAIYTPTTILIENDNILTLSRSFGLRLSLKSALCQSISIYTPYTYASTAQQFASNLYPIKKIVGIIRDIDSGVRWYHRRDSAVVSVHGVSSGHTKDHLLL